MSFDAELETWRRQWQHDGRVPADVAADVAALKERIARQSRAIKIGLIAPVLVTIVIGGAAVLRALSTTGRAEVLLAVEVWLFIAVAWAGCLWIARGTWHPRGETTVAFVALALRRCRSNRKAALFAAWLYVSQLLFTLSWKYASSDDGLVDVLTAWPVISIGWIGLPLFLAWLRWYLSRQRAELDRLFDLQRQLAEE
jgi:hypothetical protein